ncbi:MAG: NADH-quinone oxidoreductase subunit J [Acidobacteria bacterium]|nr:MAG: NADH-quinone oxidoreductase subunit J [Acidobacteriota bacterium]
MIEFGFFIFFALMAIGSALNLVLQRNPIYSALSLIIVIASMGGLFLLQHATFLAVLQIVVYAGAIMALFLFVIMMVDFEEEAHSSVSGGRTTIVLLILLAITGGCIWAITGSLSAPELLTADFSVKAISKGLFTTYVFPFEAIAVLIISSVIGALYIARKEEA